MSRTSPGTARRPSSWSISRLTQSGSSRLADDLLALSREEAATSPRADVRLDELARAVAAPDVDLRLSPVVVHGDRAALERALANLIENARRHGPPAGASR